MAQTVTRQTLKLFGGSGSSPNFSEFGSQAANAPVKTKSIPTIQSLSAWDNGWQDAVALDQAPYLEDMNGVLYVHSYQEFYSLQEGIAEWDSGTTYNVGSIVKEPYTGSLGGNIFISLTDSNTNNALPSSPASNTNWQFMYGPLQGGLIIPGRNTTGGDAPAGTQGYFLSANATVSAPTSGTWINVATLSLPAGDWDVSGIIVCTAASASLSGNFLAAVSLDSGVSTADHVSGYNQALQPTPTGSQAASVTIPLFRVTHAGSANVYAKCNITYSGGTPLVTAGIAARQR